MGQKRIITKAEGAGMAGSDAAKQAVLKLSKKTRAKKIAKGVISVHVSYNNTIVSVADMGGNVLIWSSAGSLGFRGSRKSTPYAATLVAKDALEKARGLGLMEASVVIKGIGAGREASIRGIASSGVNIVSIADNTPIPHNGVKPPKPRRV